MHEIPGNTLNLGKVAGSDETLKMTPRMRSTHLYLTGVTGTGKSKMLESLIRQDILQWHETGCGALIIDPHGSLYNSLMSWITWNQKYLGDIPIVPIDLRQKDWTIGYNIMRRRTQTDPSVLVDTTVQSMAHVFGSDRTTQTPLFGRRGRGVLWPIYDNDMTLLEAEFLIDPVNKRLRTEMTQKLSLRSVAQDWVFANSLTPKDFDAQFSSTLNRFSSFLRNEKLRLMFGQKASLDLRKAIDEGQIIIANVSTEGGRVSNEDASLFATLLINDLWTAATERGKGTDETDVKPFYVYIDEFQNFVTPTIASNLDQARGFGLHLTLANQFPRQILHTGAHGAQVYDSIMVNARSKIVFSLEGTDNLKPLAESLFMNVINPDAVKLKLYSHKVMDYIEEERIVTSTNESWSDAEGEFTGDTESDSLTGAIIDGAKQEENIWNTSKAASAGTSRIRARGGGSSESRVPFLRPVFGKELSTVQYRTVEEQIFMAMQSLCDQQQRHGVTRLVGMRAPLNIVTPTVKREPSSQAMIHSFLTRVYQRLPFALRSVEAQKQIDERHAKMIAGPQSGATEQIPAKRKIPKRGSSGSNPGPLPNP